MASCSRYPRHEPTLCHCRKLTEDGVAVFYCLDEIWQQNLHSVCSLLARPNGMEAVAYQLGRVAVHSAAASTALGCPLPAAMQPCCGGGLISPDRVLDLGEDTKRILWTLHSPAPPQCQNSERVVDSERNSRDAPRASAAALPKQRQGRPFRNIPNRILKMLLAPAPPPGQNSNRVVDSAGNSQDAPRASAATRPKQQEGRRFRNSKLVVDSERNSLDAPRARAAALPKHGESRRFRTEFAERSMRKCWQNGRQRRRNFAVCSTRHCCRARKPTRRVVDSKPNSQKAPRGSAGTRREQRKGLQSALGIRTAPQRERFNVHTCCRGFADEF